MLGAKHNRLFLSTVLFGLLAAGCDDGVTSNDPPGVAGSDGAATVRVLLTDAPSDYIGAAEVDIGLVELIPQDGGPHVVISEDGTDGFVNLLDFQGGATTPIAEAEIDPGTFVQMRLVVEAARVELAEGYAFRDGSTQKDLKVPSGAQTGIKMNLFSTDGSSGVEIVPGETVLVLDFDVSRSFVLLGNPDTPAGVHGVNFKPTLRVTGEDVAASISGTVSTELDGVSVEGLMVSAEPTDGGTVEGYQTQTGTALTDENGDYTIFFLVPGNYVVTVDLEPGLGTDPENRELMLGYSENATGADFEIIDITGSISGAVTGNPDTISVVGLTVTADPAAEGADDLTTVTDDDGLYSFEDVIPGAYTVTVTVTGDLRTLPAVQDVEVGNSEDVADVDFEVVEDLRGSISGTVSTALQGVSVVGLTVIADPAGDDNDNLETTTGDGGTYTFELVEPGDYTVTVVVGTGLTTDPVSRDVTVDNDEAEADVDFEVVSQ